MATLSNTSLFNYLPTSYGSVNLNVDSGDALYELAHDIVINATIFASSVTNLGFEDFDKERQEATEFVISKLLEHNK